jgi:transcriptional regulator with XRE-family HTH domain
VPKIRDEDKVFAERLGNVLSALRDTTGETRPEAAERLGVSETSLGRWERGEFAPKGYDLGRLYRGYLEWGADWQWFFDPPEVVTLNPVRSRLDALAQSGAIRADEAEKRVEERRRAAAAKRAAAHGRRSA